MSQDIELYVADIKSNTDKMSARAIHDSLVNLVRTEAFIGEDFMRAIVPKFDGTMAASVGHRGPIDGGLEIDAAVGIPEIHKPDESDDYSAKYPLFVNEGTGPYASRGPIGPKRGFWMVVPPERSTMGAGRNIYMMRTMGQRGRHFTAATYAVMAGMLAVNGEKFRAEVTAKLMADQLS